MGLDEYRKHVIERLKGSRDTAAARGVLAEADLILATNHLTAMMRDRFWESLQEELEVIAKDCRVLSDRKAAAKLGSIVAAAQARIARYRDHTGAPTL